MINRILHYTMLAYWPKGISVNENGEIQLSTYIGKPRLIPADQISIIEMPEGLLSHLIRTNGMSLGKINYGRFKNTKTGQKMFLYLTGKESKSALLTMGSYMLEMIGDSSYFSSVKPIDKGLYLDSIACEQESVSKH